MPVTLCLIEARARRAYTCPACLRTIQRGSLHFRHDPHPYARMFRGEPTTHWCRECILASNPGPKEFPTGRIRVPFVRVMSEPARTMDAESLWTAPELEAELPLLAPLFAPLRVELVGIGQILSEQLSQEPSLIHQLSPEQFEEFVCDRFFAMGFEPRRVGSANKKDGGVDVLFWPRLSGAFPFLGAAQMKHHRNPSTREGPATVREFAGTISGHSFNAGLLITNTSFSPDAEWYAREHAKLMRLRDFNDIRRWQLNNFCDEAEWREIPTSIELCPGVIIKIR